MDKGRNSHRHTEGTASASLFSIRDLSAACDERTVLHDISPKIYERDFLGIVGPNGGGKTTLIKCILELLRPMGGEIIKRHGPFTTGHLSQYSLIDHFFPISTLEMILSGLSSKKSLISRFDDHQCEKACQVILHIGLEGLEHHAIGQLSDGQPQRAPLGHATISDPQLLILNGLSVYIDKHFETHLCQLPTEINRDCIITLVGHDIGAVLQQVKSIVCVNETLDYHPVTGIDAEWLKRNFNCPIELLGHDAFPHRVLSPHYHCHENDKA